MRLRTLSLGILTGLILAALWFPGLALADGGPLCRVPTLAIPDADVNDTPGLLTDTLTIPGSGTLNDLNLIVRLNHTWVGDLGVSLEHLDSGARATLLDRPGLPPGTFGCSGDDLDVTFDDAAADPAETSCDAGAPALAGPVSPAEPLSVFNGESLAGTWQLSVTDASALNTGTLLEWCLVPTPLVDLAVDQAGDPAWPAATESFTYTVTIHNNGPAGASGVVVTSPLPDAVSFVSAGASQGSYEAATGLWSVGDLPAAGSAALTLLTTVNPGLAGRVFTFTAQADAPGQFDADPGNNAASLPVTVAAADLAVIKTANRTAANEGELVVFKITARNQGPQPAAGVVVNDALPEGLVFVGAAAGQGSFAGDTGLWQVGSLPANGAATLVLTASVAAGSAGQTLVNTAGIAAASPADPDLANNSDGAAVLVTSADIAVTKTASRLELKEGDVFTYTVTTRNNGPSGATGLVISDTLPLSLTLVSSATSQGRYDGNAWIISKLLAGRAVTLTVVMSVPAGLAGQTLINTAAVGALDQGDPNEVDNTATATSRVSRADLVLAKTVSHARPNAGEVLTYTVVVTNTGPDEATGVTVSDTLPLSLTLVEASPSGGSYNDATGQWQVGSLAPAANAVLTVVAAVPAEAAGLTFTNTASLADFDQTDPDPANNTAAVPVTVQNAELEIGKTADRTRLNEDQQVTYTIAVTNHGPDEATGVTVTESLPAGLALIVTGTVQGNYDPEAGLWAVGSLPAGGGASLTLTARARLGTAGQTFLNLVSVTADQSDANLANNTALLPVTVNNAELSITKESSTIRPNTGETITYTVVISNRGPDDASGVVVSDTLPAGLTFIAANPSQGNYNNSLGRWDLGSLPAGQTASLSVAAVVNPDMAGRTLINTAVISESDQSDLDPGNNVVSISASVPEIDLALTKSVDWNRLKEGDTPAYTIVVQNAGPDEATGVVISDVLPAGLAFVSANASQGGYDGAGRWTVGELLAGQSATLLLTAQVLTGTAGQTLTNTATVAVVDQGDVKPDNNSAAAVVTVSRADLALTKTASRSRVRENAELIYTLVISNAGPDDATGVVVAEQLNWRLDLLEATASQGEYDRPGGQWRVGDLPANTGAVLTLSVAVKPGAAGLTIGNTAAIKPFDQSDPDLANNQSGVDVRVSNANLKIAKTVDRTEVKEQDRLSYTLIVTNQGPDDANGVLVEENFPAGLGLVVSNTTRGDYRVGQGFWDVGDLPVGQSATLSLDAIVKAGMVGQTFTNTARVSATDQSDADLSDNVASVTNRVPDAELRLALAADKTRAVENELVTYTVTVANAGPDLATGLVISAPLPAGLTFASANSGAGNYSSGTGLWTVGSLPAGQQASLTLAARVSPGFARQTLTTSVGIDTVNQSDSNPANNTASTAIYVPGADLALTKTANKTEAQELNRVTFTIQVVNQGPDDATGVVISDTLPAGLRLVSVTPTVGQYNPATGLWTIGALDFRAKARLTVVTRVPEGTGGLVITNTAAVYAAVPADPDLLDNVATAVITLTGSDLAVAGAAWSGPPVLGDVLTYTLTAANYGPSPANNVTLQVDWPAGLNLAGTLPGAPGCLLSAGQVTCALGALAPGATTDVGLVVTSTLATTANFTIRVSGPGLDPNPANNTLVSSITFAPRIPPEEGGSELPLFLPFIGKEGE